jgi:hypothetical protein
MSKGPFLRKYGVAATLDFDLFEIDGVDFRVDAVHAVGDTVIMKDEAAEANTTNAFVDEGQTYSIILTATEMQAARVKVVIVDQTAPKVWLDTSFTIETYGNASAEHAFDLDTALVTLAAATHTGAVIPTVTNLTNLPSIPANWLTAAGIAAAALNGKGNWNIGKTGYALTTAGILAIWDQLEAAVVTASTMGLKIKTNLNALITSRQPSGAVDLNADQSGVTIGTVTTLTNLPSIPANWLTAAGIAASALDGKGNWNTDKTGFSLSAAGILAIWHQASAAIVTADTIGKLLKDEILPARMAELDAANLPADIANLNNLSTADILTQVNAALDTTIAELGVGAPVATPTLRTGLMLLYMALRNQTIVQTSGTDALEIHNDAGTRIAQKLLTDDGADYTEAEMISGV